MFEIGGGSFGVVIGDVCGKGPDAAAVTALARYTLRATALTEDSPAQVLRTLNEAILKQPGERRFCTVAYVRFDPTPPGMVATIAPAAIRCRWRCARGPSRPRSGTPGTLLGVVDDPDIDDTRLDLFPGDCAGAVHRRRDRGAGAQAGLGVERPGPLRGRARAAAGRGDRRADRARGAGGTGRGARDDVAIVVLKVTAAGARAPDVPRSEGIPAV